VTEADQAHMRRAIALARPNLGQTGENPSVGCVIVRGGTVVGEGVTGVGGRPHAEEIAIQAAGEVAQGGVADVTLEPCAARSSGAPSCASRLAAAGVVEVVVACQDASAYADGQGLAHLATAGVRVRLGVLAEEAQVLYRAYIPTASRPPGD